MASRTSTRTSTKRKAAPRGFPKRGDWGILFYIAGESGVTSGMISELKAVTDAGFQQNTNVLVYFDPNCNGANARIFEVNRRRKQGRKTQIGDDEDPYVRNIAEDCYGPPLKAMSAAQSLHYFLRYARTYYPAKHYLLFLMGHGVIVGNDTFLPDPDDLSSITLRQLGWILKNFGKNVRKAQGEFHLVGLHSCSMSAVEVAYQLRDSARYMMATEGSAFPNSWPYRQLLKKIFLIIDGRYPPTRPGDERASHETSVQYMLRRIQDLSFYNSQDFWLAGYSADLAMCNLDTDKVERIKKPLQQLVRALKAGLTDSDKRVTEIIVLAHWKSQSYWGENFTDLYDFCRCLTQLCVEKTKSQSAISDACIEVQKVLKTNPAKPFDQLVVFSDYFGPNFQYSHGLSIYFPWITPTKERLRVYQSYDFTPTHGTDTWLSFLWEYFEATQRHYRGEGQPVSFEERPNAGFFSGKTGPPLAPPSNKTGPPLGPGSNMTGPRLSPPSNKTGPPLGPHSDKTGPPLGPPGDKTGPPLGGYEVSVIKNYPSPRKLLITSRPKRKKTPKKGNGKRGKPSRKSR
jgi:hypothetical protein